MISLVVSVYNVKPYINEFLDSVINQTFEDFEAVLVDDGSTDGSGDLLDDYAKKSSKLKVIHKENGGCISAWKRGVLESSGEYVSFADPDDILKPDMLEVLYNLMTENAADLVITGITRLENGRIYDTPADGWNLPERLYSGEKLKEIKNNLFGNPKKRDNIFFFARWNKLFKKEILLKNFDFTDNRVKFGEDVCASASAIYDSEKLYYSHTPLYIYRIRDDSLTTVNFNPAEMDNALYLRDSVRHMITEKGYMNEFIYYNDPSYHIVRVMRKINQTSNAKSEKKQFLRAWKSHEYVVQYDLKKAKKYISRRRYLVIWLLKHSFYSLLLKIL